MYHSDKPKVFRHSVFWSSYLPCATKALVKQGHFLSKIKNHEKEWILRRMTAKLAERQKQKGSEERGLITVALWLFLQTEQSELPRLRPPRL